MEHSNEQMTDTKMEATMEATMESTTATGHSDSRTRPLHEQQQQHRNTAGDDPSILLGQPQSAVHAHLHHEVQQQHQERPQECLSDEKQRKLRELYSRPSSGGQARGDPHDYSTNTHTHRHDYRHDHSHDYSHDYSHQYQQQHQTQHQHMGMGMDMESRGESKRRESLGACSTSSTASSEASVMTEPMSNTTDTRIEKKRRHHRFLKLTHVLLKVLERRDRDTHIKAKAIIDDCQARKRAKEPGFESLGESIKAPLRSLVNRAHWKEATRIIGFKRQERAFRTRRSSTKRAFVEAQTALDPIPMDVASSQAANYVTQETAAFLGHLAGRDQMHTSQPIVHQNTSNHQPMQQQYQQKQQKQQFDHQADALLVKQQQKKQKQKFWLLLRVLMKYLEKKDKALHLKARSVMDDCIERNKHNEPGYSSLTSITRQRMRDLVDPVYWNRAECYLGGVLAKKDAKSRRSSRSSSTANNSHSSNSNVVDNNVVDSKSRPDNRKRRISSIPMETNDTDNYPSRAQPQRQTQHQTGTPSVTAKLGATLVVSNEQQPFQVPSSSVAFTQQLEPPSTVTPADSPKCTRRDAVSLMQFDELDPFPIYHTMTANPLQEMPMPDKVWSIPSPVNTMDTASQSSPLVHSSLDKASVHSASSSCSSNNSRSSTGYVRSRTSRHSREARKDRFFLDDASITHHSLKRVRY